MSKTLEDRVTALEKAVSLLMGGPFILRVPEGTTKETLEEFTKLGRAGNAQVIDESHVFKEAPEALPPRTASEHLALSTQTFDAEYLIQILGPFGEVLVTVGQPAGPSEVREFHIWQGVAVDEATGDDDPPLFVVRVEAGRVKSAWIEAVSSGFAFAIQFLASRNSWR